MNITLLKQLPVEIIWLSASFILFQILSIITRLLKWRARDKKWIDLFSEIIKLTRTIAELCGWILALDLLCRTIPMFI